MADKIGYLDGLRGIASLVVVFHHYCQLFYPALVFTGVVAFHIGPIESLIAASPLNLLYNGGFAVCIFFSLSGYVLTRKFFSTGEQEALTSGAARRYARLAIPVLFTLILVYIFFNLHLYKDLGISKLSGYQWITEEPRVGANVINVIENALWGVFFGNQSYGYFVLWTMTVEFIGSFIVFSFASLFGRMRNRWIFYAVACLFFLNTYYLAFILGMILSDLFNSPGGYYTIKGRPTLFAILVTGLFLGSYDLGGWWGLGIYKLLGISLADPSMLFRMIGAAMVLAVLLNSNLLQNLLNRKIPLFLGKISFTMYLLHMLVISTLSSQLFFILYPVTSYNVATIIIFAISLPVIMAFSYLAYRYVDDPGTRLSRSIYERYFNGEQKPADWKAIANRVSTFTRKNMSTLVVAEVLLVILIGATVVVIKPTMEQNNARTAYNEDYSRLAVSFDTLAAYPPANNTTPMAYRKWLDGYEGEQGDFMMAYGEADHSAARYKPYVNNTSSDYRAMEWNMQFYRALLNASINRSNAYEDNYRAMIKDFTVMRVSRNQTGSSE